MPQWIVKRHTEDDDDKWHRMCWQGALLFRMRAYYKGDYRLISGRGEVQLYGNPKQGEFMRACLEKPNCLSMRFNVGEYDGSSDCLFLVRVNPFQFEVFLDGYYALEIPNIKPDYRIAFNTAIGAMCLVFEGNELCFDATKSDVIKYNLSGHAVERYSDVTGILDVGHMIVVLDPKY